MTHDISPIDWMNTKVSQPAYAWILAFGLVAATSFGVGAGLTKYINSGNQGSTATPPLD